MKHFDFKELTHSDTAKAKGIDNTPNDTEKKNLENLVKYVLDPLRDMYGKPIYVNSGYRSEALNKAVGGSNISQHRLGMAADIDTHTREGNIELFNLIAKNLSFDQLIDEKDYSWIHVSFDPKRLRNQILHL